MLRWLFLVTTVVAGACGGHDVGDIDGVIGDSCRDDRDCDTRCYIDNDLPGGFCSLPCQSDRDCPGDSYCMATNGGMCLYGCPDFDCSRLGAGWTCRDRDREGGGKINVCSGG